MKRVSFFQTKMSFSSSRLRMRPVSSLACSSSRPGAVRPPVEGRRMTHTRPAGALTGVWEGLDLYKEVLAAQAVEAAGFEAAVLLEEVAEAREGALLGQRQVFRPRPAAAVGAAASAEMRDE